MASCRDCPCDSASCRNSRQEALTRTVSWQEAESHGQSLQESIYQAQQSQQEARDHGQSQQKPNMMDSLCRKRKLADSFIPCGSVTHLVKNTQVSDVRLIWTPCIILGQTLQSVKHYAVINPLVPNKNCSRRLFIFLLPSFQGNKAWCFMWILCLAEDSHEISSLIFSEKLWKSIYKRHLLQSWLAL